MSYRIFTSISITLVKLTETKKVFVLGISGSCKKWCGWALTPRGKQREKRQVKTKTQGQVKDNQSHACNPFNLLFLRNIYTNFCRSGELFTSVWWKIKHSEESDTANLVTYQQKLAPLLTVWSQAVWGLMFLLINKIIKKGNVHNNWDYPLWNGPFCTLLGKSFFMSKLILAPTTCTTFFLFQPISNTNPKVNSHFSHRQGVVPWRTCGTTNE